MPPAKKATKKGPTVTVENARTYEDMHLTVNGLEPGVYTMTLDHPDMCVECGEFEEWKSIHDDTPLEIHSCGNTVARIYTPPALYAVGGHGSETRRVDSTEKKWSEDMSAYKRLRDDGIQPERLTGARQMEQSAQSRFEIQSGLKGIPEHRVAETYDMMRDQGLPLP